MLIELRNDEVHVKCRHLLIGTRQSYAMQGAPWRVVGHPWQGSDWMA